MTDETVNDESTNDEKGEQSASAIFVELMRQAAAKASPKPAPADAGKVAEPDSVDEPSLEPKGEEPQIQRVRPRLGLRRPPPGSLAGGFFGTVFVVVVSTALVATLLMFFVNPEFLNPAVVQGLQLERDEDYGGHRGGGAHRGTDAAMAAPHRRHLRASRTRPKPGLRPRRRLL